MTDVTVHETKQVRNTAYCLKLLFCALLILAFFTFDIIDNAAYVFRAAEKDAAVVNAVCLVGLCWLLDKAAAVIGSAEGGPAAAVLQGILSVFFSVFSVLSIYFEREPSEPLGNILQSWNSGIAFGTAVLGGVLLFLILFRLIWKLSGTMEKQKFCGQGRLAAFFGEHLYRNCILVMLAGWLPQYVIRFPGTMTYDGWQSIAMYYGYTETTTQHPLVWGILMGKLTDLGVRIGVSWLMPLVICLVQHALAMALVSYTVATIKKLGASEKILAGVLAFYVILPPMSLYASTVYNDFLYSLAIQLLTVELAYYLYDRRGYFSGFRHILLTALAIFGTIVRYNGLYTMLAVLLAVGVRELWLLLRSRTRLVQSAVVVLAMLVPLVGGQMLQAALNQKYDAKEITSRAMLAMPIQQSVRCLIEHGDEMPRTEYDAVHAVLTWSDETYAEKYNPRNFDKVKESFKIDASKEELLAFLKAWIKLILRYPETCVMATANQTYYLFSPLVRNVRYFTSLSAHKDLALSRYGFDASPYVLTDPVREAWAEKLQLFHDVVFPELPILGLTVNQAVYTILLIGVCVCVLLRRDRRPLLMAVSLLVTLAITFVGPAVYWHPRYVYPIMFSMPVFIAAFMINEPAKKEEGK